MNIKRFIFGICEDYSSVINQFLKDNYAKAISVTPNYMYDKYDTTGELCNQWCEVVLIFDILDSI